MNRIEKTINKISTIISSPNILKEFLKYKYSKLKNGGSALRTIRGEVEITGFSSFTEYLQSGNTVYPYEHSFFESFPVRNGSIVDVGANLGIVSLVLANRFPGRQVHAFEAHPSTVKSLRESVKINGRDNVSIYNEGVDESSGTMYFRATRKSRFGAAKTEASGENVVEISTVSLDEWARSQGVSEVALLKVDVEGHELSVFRGGEVLA